MEVNYKGTSGLSLSELPTEAASLSLPDLWAGEARLPAPQAYLGTWTRKHCQDRKV